MKVRLKDIVGDKLPVVQYSHDIMTDTLVFEADEISDLEVEVADVDEVTGLLFAEHNKQCRLMSCECIAEFSKTAKALSEWAYIIPKRKE